MSSSFEKSVKGATKIKNAPPKTKYIEHILVATHSGEAGIAEVIRALQYRLRDSTWTVVFKSLITAHLMIREGSPDVTLSYLSKNRNSLAISNFTDAVTHGRNIRHYANYLSERTRAYRETKVDWVRVSDSKLETMTVEKGLLRQTEIVQRQMHALLKCDVLDSEPETEITITVFRLLVLDLLALFQVANQGLINILGHFFEMSKTDAERSLDIYRHFTRQTELVVAYLSVARQHEHHTRVQVPKLKHAPVHLARQLEDYLNDPDFEVNRRQYMAEQEVKGTSGTSGLASSKPPKVAKDSDFPEPASNNPFPRSNGTTTTETKAEAKPPQASKGPDADLIDFFESIEQNQTTMPVANSQPTGVPTNNVGFQQQQQPTGMQFAQAGYPQQQPQQTGFSTNPYQQQMQQPQATGNNFYQQPQQPQQQQLQPNFTGAGFGGFTPQQNYQPGSLGTIPQESVASFQQQAHGGSQPMSPVQQQQPQLGSLQPMQTGTTNPFRQSMLMTQQTGMVQQQQPLPTGMQSPPSSGISSPVNPTLSRQSTNPFARSPQNQSPFNSGNNSPFQQQQQQQQSPPVAPLQATPTGTNPFARQTSPQAVDATRPQTAGGALAPQPTGSTNPFRQSAFVNHATGMGWHHNQQPIGGGLDQLPTQQVFPRPAQQTPWQQ